MPRRVVTFLFACAIALMVLALGWLFREMLGSADLPTPLVTEVRSVPKKAARASTPPPSGALTTEQLQAHTATTPVDPAKDLAQALAHPHAVPGEALLTFRNQAALAAFRARAAAQGLEIIGIDPTLLTARVRYRDIAGLLAEVRDHADELAHAGPNWVTRIPGLPAAQPQKDGSNAGGDTKFLSQGLDLIGAAANRSGWGKGITVAVLDSGITDHPALNGAVKSHIDLVGDGSAPHGHGTAMASLIAGRDSTAAGVSPAADLIDIRVADAKGSSNTALLSSGIVRAVQDGAKVINISLGSTQSSPVLENAVQYALSHGVVLIAAAGNEQQNMLSYPAGIPGVISVAAVDAAGRQAWFSNSGQGLSVAAPGVGIISAYTDQRIVIGSGTSQSAALTSGAVAYLLGRGYQAQNISQIITRNARPTGAPATAVGAGILHLP